MNINITKDSGLTVSYHRISKIVINYLKKQCTLYIEEYISEHYRAKAKEVESIRSSLETLYTQTESTTDTQLLESLNSKILNLEKTYNHLLNSNFVANTSILNLDFIPDDTTITGFYNELKKLDIYKDSTEI